MENPVKKEHFWARLLNCSFGRQLHFHSSRSMKLNLGFSKTFFSKFERMYKFLECLGVKANERSLGQIAARLSEIERMVGLLHKASEKSQLSLQLNVAKSMPNETSQQQRQQIEGP